MNDPLLLFAACPHYSEPLLREELLELGVGGELRETSGGVFFGGDIGTALRVCLWSRLAGRVYLELASEQVTTREDLYALARSIPWHEFFRRDRSFAVAAFSSHPAFRSENMGALIVKDAVADHFREREGVRPSVNTEAPDIRLYAYLSAKLCSIYLDLSGDSLHQRGYRLSRTAAPLRENTAAAVLARAGWYKAVARWRAGEGAPPVLVDPLCGSGTLAIEAAMAAVDAAPGLGRRRFGIEASLLHNGPLLRQLRDEASLRRTEGIEAFSRAAGRIWASDIDAEVMQSCADNITRAGLREIITTGCVDFSRLTRGAVLGEWNKVWDTPQAPPCFLVTNPPYGVRIGSSESTDNPDELYGRLGAWLAAGFEGARAVVLAEDKQQAKFLGLRAEKLNTLYNGRLKIVAALLNLEAANRYLERSPAAADPSSGPAMLLNRLRRNAAELSEYLQERELSCYRLYDADIPQYAAAVDLYTETNGARHLVIQEYAPPPSIEAAASARRFDELLDTVRAFAESAGQARSTAPLRLHIKQRKRQRGENQYTPGRHGEEGRVADPRSSSGTVAENGLLFELNFRDYIDTGLFLDHRELRRRVREEAMDRHVLNLFAYTCSVSVYAAAGGARTTVSVDTSRNYLDWGRRNFQLNGLLSSADHFVRRDCMEFLQECRDEFDLIFVDPPSFSNSKSREGVFDVQRDHEHLLRSALRLLSADGILYFSTNLKSFSLSESLHAVAQINEITQEVTPPDFTRKLKHRHVFELRHARTTTG